MKKSILLLLVIVMSLSFCACGLINLGNDEDAYDVESEIESAIQAEAAVSCMFTYDSVKNVLANCTNIDDNGDGTYEVKGYVTVIDDYGDKYKGKFDAVVEVDESGEADCIEFDLETPTKQ